MYQQELGTDLDAAVVDDVPLDNVDVLQARDGLGEMGRCARVADYREDSRILSSSLHR